MNLDLPLAETNVITTRNEVGARLYFSQASVILLKEGSASVHAGIPPPEQALPRADPPEQTPQEQAPPRNRYPPWEQTPPA